MKNLLNEKKNYVAELLQQDTIRQIYDDNETQEFPTLLEIKGIMIEQVEKLPANMIGRIKIVLNKVLWNINNVDHNKLDEQLMYLKQLMMIWKIISQKRVRSNSTYTGFTPRSDMDYTLRLIENEKWTAAWQNMLLNKIERNLKNTPALMRLNDLLHNIHENKGIFNYDDNNADVKMEDENNQIIYKKNTRN